MPDPTRPRSSLKVVVVALLAVPLLLLGGLALAAELRARRLSVALVDEAIGLATFSGVRTPHRDATSGSLSECLGAALDSSPDVSRAVPWMSALVLDVRAGRAPLEALAPDALAAVTTFDPWLRRTLACTRFEALTPLPGLGPLAEPLHPRRQALPRLQEATAALTPLRVRALVVHHQVAEALEVCADQLALTTALLELEGPEASLGVLGQATGLIEPCADAVKGASSGELQVFSVQLEKVRAQVPTYSRVMALERVNQSLRIFGGLLPAAQVARLPPGGRSMVATASSWSRQPQERLALSLWWSSFDRAFTGLIDAADLGEPARTRKILLAQRGFSSVWVSLLRVPPLDVRYQMYAESHEVVPTVIELLQLAAAVSAKTIRPPSALVEVRPRGDGVVLVPRRAELARLEVVLPGTASR